MKKHLPLWAVLLAVLLLAGCSSPEMGVSASSQEPAVSTTDQTTLGAEVVLIASESSLASAFGQGIWNTLSRFAGESGLSSVFYQAEEGDVNAAASTLELAAKSGAELVVSTDAEVTGVILSKLYQYPDISFVLLDAPPDVRMPDNAVSIRFSAEEAGWLAGYVAGTQQNSRYGYVAQVDDEAQKFLLGYVMGLDMALEEAAGAGGTEEGLLQADLTGLVLDDELSEEDWDAQVQALLLDVRAPEEPTITVAAGEQAQALALQQVPLAHGLVAGVQVLPWPQTYAVASVEFDAKRLVQDVVERWKDGRFPGGQILAGGVAYEDIQLLVQAQDSMKAVEKAPQAALGYYERNNVKSQLAQMLSSGEDGLPTVEELELGHLRQRPMGAEDPDASKTASLPVEADSSMVEE